MRLIIMGAPGAGKGTIALAIKEIYNIPHISTGDMFREAIKLNSPLGKIASEYINKGELVPDDVTIGIVEERLNQDDCQTGFIFDGFPRTLAQAEALASLLTKMKIKLNGVLDVQVEEEFLIKRLSGRRVCPNCGASYHIINIPPKIEGICDVCKTSLIQRADDAESTIRHRLEVYKKNTFPLLAYYKNLGLVVAIEGHGLAKENFEKIAHLLEDSK